LDTFKNDRYQVFQDRGWTSLREGLEAESEIN